MFVGLKNNQLYLFFYTTNTFSFFLELCFSFIDFLVKTISSFVNFLVNFLVTMIITEYKKIMKKRQKPNTNIYCYAQSPLQELEEFLPADCTL